LQRAREEATASVERTVSGVKECALQPLEDVKSLPPLMLPSSHGTAAYDWPSTHDLERIQKVQLVS
jgi:hypothetical protein